MHVQHGPHMQQQQQSDLSWRNSSVHNQLISTRIWLSPQIVIVGGGAGGVELCLAMHHSMTHLAGGEPRTGSPTAHLALVSHGPILATMTGYARRAILPIMKVREVVQARQSAFTAMKAGRAIAVNL